MVFDYDIYISYDNSDNLDDNGKGGWVTNFKKFLEIMMGQITGKKPVILHYSNQEKPSSAQLSKVAILISIVSPNYVSSNTCIEDIEEFFRKISAENDQNAVQRVFKVIKSPVTIESQPSKLRNLLNYDLYYTDPVSGAVQEFDEYFGIDAERNYWMKLVDLAYDLHNSLSRLKGEVQVEAESGRIKTVYLAETGQDLAVQRNIIKRELLRKGFKVLPSQSMPTNLKEMESSIKKEIEASELSIHMIGDSYGDIPSGSDISIIEIQNKIAVDRSNMISAVQGPNSGKFSRLIWLSPEAKLKNEKQKRFVENLKRDAEVIEGAEVLQTPIEDFKSIIKGELAAALEKRQKNIHAALQTNITSKRIYVLFDYADRFACKELIDEIEKKGFKVLLPEFEGELIAIRQKHIENLIVCDAAIIYFNQVNEQWVKMKVLDLLKAPGFGRNQPMVHKAVFVDHKNDIPPDYFQKHGVRVINNTGINSNEFLNSFLTKLTIEK